MAKEATTFPIFLPNQAKIPTEPISFVVHKIVTLLLFTISFITSKKVTERSQL